MKIYKNIFPEMISMESLLNAWDEFKKGKRSKADVQEFELHLEDNLFRLHRDLKNKKYKHGSYAGFYIRDPKVRRIHKAEVQDRVVHHVIFQHLNPVFESSFIADSYSCRKDKGTHKGVKRLGVFARKVYQTHGCCFVLKCDIRKFFFTIDHKILIDIIARRIKDPDVLWFIKMIVDSFSSEFSEDNSLKGIPIGNLTSQLFANIYMNEFDQFIKHDLRVAYYARYTDDFVIVHHDKDYLLDIKNKIADFLESNLKLSLHPGKVEIRKYRQGVDFLGYVTLPKARMLRTKVRRRIFKKLHTYARQFKDGKITEEALLRSFDSYLGVLSHADSHRLKQELRQKVWEWVKEP
jgi:RNA-directed DNA polymerase